MSGNIAPYNSVLCSVIRSVPPTLAASFRRDERESLRLVSGSRLPSTTRSQPPHRFCRTSPYCAAKRRGETRLKIPPHLQTALCMRRTVLERDSRILAVFADAAAVTEIRKKYRTFLPQADQSSEAQNQTLNHIGSHLRLIYCQNIQCRAQTKLPREIPGQAEVVQAAKQHLQRGDSEYERVRVKNCR